MKTIDMFSNIAAQAFEDNHIRKYSYILVSRGLSGIGKINPTALWVDATVAVTEAISSYFRYCAESEITQQLQDYNQALEKTLNNELKIGKLTLDELRLERTMRQDKIKNQLIKTKAYSNLTNKKIRNQLDILQRIQILLHKERSRVGFFRELIGLQICLDNCIDATLALLISFNGDNT